MNKLMKAALTASASLLVVAAQAAPVSLGSIEHLYGSSAGRTPATVMSVFHPGGNCDTLNASSITVKATSAASCNRFADTFDFSGLDFADIDHFQVTLNFSGARDQTVGLERWLVRASPNYVQSSASFGTLNASGSQTFTFASSQGLFDDIVNAQSFVLMFSTSYGSSMNFTLNSAKLEVFGTAPAAVVPEPGSLALAGLALLGLGAARRVRKG